ncbi:hypothetical protein GCM10010517_32930 [Streptosporangium fragile]|uniref:CusB-like beta-barrel domain-containing protein n=1 Tax=Streptosporangium fragile TaxID=46186 RepID=A0ABN3VX70_9ACTN
MRPTHLPKNVRVGGLALAALLLVGGGVVVALDDGSAGEPRVELAAARRGTVTAEVSAAGSTVDGGTRELGFGGSGTVTKVYVKAGDKVDKGDVLARIGSAPARERYAEAKARLAAAEEALDKATSAATTPSPGQGQNGTRSGLTGSDQSGQERQAGCEPTATRTPRAGTTPAPTGTGTPGPDRTAAPSATATPEPTPIPVVSGNDAPGSGKAGPDPVPATADKPGPAPTAPAAPAGGIAPAAYVHAQAPAAAPIPAPTRPAAADATTAAQNAAPGATAAPGPAGPDRQTPWPGEQAPQPAPTVTVTVTAAPTVAVTATATVTVTPAPPTHAGPSRGPSTGSGDDGANGPERGPTAGPTATARPTPTAGPTPGGTATPRPTGCPTPGGGTDAGAPRIAAPSPGQDSTGGGQTRTGTGPGNGSTGTGGGGQGTLGVEQAEVRVKQARAELTDAKEELAGVRIVAPADGTVMSVAGAVGDSAGTGAFVTIGNLDELQVEALFTESDIGSLKLGQRATVTLATRPGKKYAGTVTGIAPTATTTDRLVRYGVKVVLDEPPADLLVGQTATVTVTVAESVEALYVPAQAVRTAGGVSRVTVQGGGERVVKTGVRSDRYVEITSGLGENDRVVLPGATTGEFPDGSWPEAGAGTS